MKTTLLVMALNEIDGMKAIMPQVRPDWVDQILVCDGGSTDGTVAWAREQGYDVVEQTRPGIRWGYIEALPRIRGDAVITFSYLFTGGAAPVLPSPSATSYAPGDCGPDPTDDDALDCGAIAAPCQ